MAGLPEYDVLHFCFDNDHGCSLIVLTNNERFHVTVDPKQFQDRSKKGKQIQQTYRRLLRKAKVAEQSEEDEEALSSSEDSEDEEDTDNGASTEQERDSAVDVSTPEIDEKQDQESATTEPVTALHNWILTPLAQHLPSHGSKSKTSLQDWYHTPIQYYKLSTTSGKLEAKKDLSPPWALRDRLRELLVPTVSIPKKTLKLSVPQISADDLVVLSCATDPAPFHPVLVSHKGKEYFFKPVDSTQPGPTVREIHLLHSIAEKGLHERKDFRCPELKGLVYFEESDPKSSEGEKKHIAGLLLTPIPHPTPLTRLLDSEVPEQQRAAWAKDVARMVEVLHENDIVWGDAKGDNFLVDGEEEKVWIIDFGGMYTEGWVDKEIKETEEGDWMGTEKIVNALEDPVNGVEDEDVESAGDGKDRSGGAEEEQEEEKQEEEEEEAVEEDVQEPGEDTQPNAEEAGSGEDRARFVDTGDDEDMEGSQKIKPSDKHHTNGKTSPSTSATRKRSHSSTASSNDTQPRPSKQKKHRSGGETEDPTYCVCNGASSGRMLACDGENCKREWFHFECLGIEEAPKEHSWFCEECRG